MRYIGYRTQSEGVTFLTTTLPRLDRALLKFLEDGVWESPKGFKPYTEVLVCVNGRDKVHIVPCFLRHIWIALLTGVPAWRIVWEGSESSITALGVLMQRVRSLLLSCYKLESPCTEVQLMTAVEGFVETERELSEFHLPPDNAVVEEAEHIVAAIFDGFDLVTSLRENTGLPLRFTPRHGPGAVAGGERLDEKWKFSTLYETLHRVFPYFEYMYGIRSNGRALQLAACASAYRNLERRPYPVAKLVAVPKDSRGPRLISEEPLEVQFMQQALARPMMTFLEGHSKVCKGRINFASQRVNAAIALDSSRSREFATIDMKDASDRVHLALVERIFPPELVRAFLALRSHATLLPTGEELVLRKFAPMGSALCFPVESVVFYAICVATLVVRRGYHLDLASQLVTVYGDDIIVPSKDALAVMEELETLALKVNVAKSFVRGHFRESCGTDAWLGQNVTPLKLRKWPGFEPSSGENVLAYCAYAGRLYDLGCAQSARYVRFELNKALGWLPTTEEPTGYVSIVQSSPPSELSEYPSRKWDDELQQWTSLLYCARQKRTKCELTGWERLMRGILMPTRDLSPDWNTVRSAVTLRRKRVIVQARV